MDSYLRLYVAGVLWLFASALLFYLTDRFFRWQASVLKKTQDAIKEDDSPNDDKP